MSLSCSQFISVKQKKNWTVKTDITDVVKIILWSIILSDTQKQ